MAERRLRGEERDALLRANLVPLGEHERPRPVLISVVLCALVAVGNVVLWAAGWEVRGQSLNAAAAIAPAILFGWLGVGLWQGKLLAIAGMQVVLALTALSATAALLVASDAGSALLSFGVLAVCAALFWPLIRVNARAGLRDRVERHG